MARRIYVVLYKSLKKKPVYKQKENKIGREREMEVTQIHCYNPYKSLKQLTTTTTCFPYWKNTINNSIFFSCMKLLTNLHIYIIIWMKNNLHVIQSFLYQANVTQNMVGFLSSSLICDRRNYIKWRACCMPSLLLNPKKYGHMLIFHPYWVSHLTLLWSQSKISFKIPPCSSKSK